MTTHECHKKFWKKKPLKNALPLNEPINVLTFIKIWSFARILIDPKRNIHISWKWDIIDSWDSAEICCKVFYHRESSNNTRPLENNPPGIVWVQQFLLLRFVSRGRAYIFYFVISACFDYTGLSIWKYFSVNFLILSVVAKKQQLSE